MMLLSQQPSTRVHGAGLTMLEMVMLLALTDLSTPPPASPSPCVAYTFLAQRPGARGRDLGVEGGEGVHAEDDVHSGEVVGHVGPDRDRLVAEDDVRVHQALGLNVSSSGACDGRHVSRVTGDCPDALWPCTLDELRCHQRDVTACVRKRCRGCRAYPRWAEDCRAIAGAADAR